jgi:hypothetical protein
MLPGLQDIASASAGTVTLYTSCTPLRALHVLVIVIDTLVYRGVSVLHGRPAAKVIKQTCGVKTGVQGGVALVPDFVRWVIS